MAVMWIYSRMTIFNFCSPDQTLRENTSVNSLLLKLHSTKLHKKGRLLCFWWCLNSKEKKINWKIELSSFKHIRLSFRYISCQSKELILAALICFEIQNYYSEMQTRCWGQTTWRRNKDQKGTKKETGEGLGSNLTNLEKKRKYKQSKWTRAVPPRFC